MDKIKELGEGIVKGLGPVFAELKSMSEKQVSTIESLLEEIKSTSLSGNKDFVFSLEEMLKGASTKTEKGDVRNEPGLKAARFMKLALLQQKDAAKGKFYEIEVLAEKMYGEIDPSFVEEIKQISVSDNVDGGYLVPEQYASEITQLLYSRTVVMELGARRVPMPGGNLNIPKLISGSSAGYIGENSPKNANRPKYTNVKLSGKKLANVVPISNDILRSTSYSSDMYVRDDLVTQMALVMDANFLFGTGSEFAPKGIKNLVPALNKIAVAALPDTENTYAQVVNVEGNNSLMIKPGWTFNSTMKGILYNLKDGDGRYLHREEIRKGLFHGFPYKVSNQITTGTGTKKLTDLYFGDWAECLVGEQVQLVIKMSEEATYSDENGNQISSFANDQTVMFAMAIHDFNIPRAQTMTVYSYQTVV